MKRRSLSPFAITQVLMAAIIGVALWYAYWPWRWGQVRDEVHRRYSVLKYIDGGDLQRWIAGRTAPPLLLDVRSAAEFEASHLPGARRAVPGASLAANQLTGNENAQVVVYDTVGFEAASFAHDLTKAHFKDVQVLEGGIFLWANEKRTLIGPGGSVTTKVHAGDSKYASLLDGAHRAP